MGRPARARRNVSDQSAVERRKHRSHFLAGYIAFVPRQPVIATPGFLPIAPVARRLPSTRSVLPYAPQDADYVRLPVGPGAVHAMRYGHGGPAVLLVHGFTTSAPLWQKVAPILLGRGCQVIVPDLLGFGESDRPLGGAYSISAQARYLDRALALLRVSRVVAVGQDLGCVMLRRLAAVRPERVHSLIFCSPTPGDAPRGPEIDAVREQTGPALLEISSRPLGVVDLIGPVLRAAVSQPASMSDTLIARFAAPYTGSQGARHLLDLARAVAEAEDEVPGISDSGVLRVTGEDDPMVLASTEPMLRLDGARRLLPLERPEPLAALIMDSVSQMQNSSVSLEERDDLD